MKDFKIALCQMRVGEDKWNNIQRAVSMIEEAADHGAELIVLPEMFNCPYDSKRFRQYAERLGDGETINELSKVAKTKGVFIVGGSLPELDNENIYNTSVIFDDNGNILDKHRKVHLFDVEIEGGIRFKESETLLSGDKITVVDTQLGKLGVAICYDIRFPELLREMAIRGAEIIIVPAAFNMTTGPAHWELLIRARGVDNQVYMVAVSPARDVTGCYVAYGHSMVVDPWGDIVSKCNEDEAIVYYQFNSTRIKDIRNQLPLLKHRREDVYKNF